MEKQTRIRGLTPTSPNVRRALLIVIGATIAMATAARSGTVVDDSSANELTTRVRENLASTLRARGFHVRDPAMDIAPVGSPAIPRSVVGALGRRLFVALASTAPDTPRDLYRLEARTTRDGGVVAVDWIVNLSRSERADDALLAVEGHRVATAVSWEGQLAALEVRNLSGEDPVIAGTADWPFWQRTGDRIANLERTGQLVGVSLTHLAVQEPVPVPDYMQLDGQKLTLYGGGQSGEES